MGVVDIQFVHPEKWCPIPHLGQGCPQPGCLRHQIWTPCQLVRLKEVEPDWKLHRSSFLMDSYIALHRFCIFDYLDLFGFFQSQKALWSRLVPIPVDLVWEYFWGQFHFFSVGLGLFQMGIFVRQNQCQHIVCHIHVYITNVHQCIQNNSQINCLSGALSVFTLSLIFLDIVVQ